MGLSYLSNYSTADYVLQQSLELPQDLLELVSFQDEFTLADTSIDPLFHPLPQKQPNFVSRPQLLTTQYDTPYLHSCKRRKQIPSQQTDAHFSYDSMLASGAPFFDGSGSAEALHLAQEFQADGQSWVDYVPFSPDVFASGTTTYDGPGGHMCGGGGGLSAQSIAARQRRRKIADKTQELGKLIPGGHRMNTAEMFQSASMYVKYLQAQIAMLTLTNSIQEEAGSSECFERERDIILQVLAASPVVQEKLYSQETCLVPRKLIQSLSSDSELQSRKPPVIKQINSLLAAQAE
uniref:BHLH domain-containing protein n=1 Tax=Kalanchoe fedtschenkoi TaxID=63787 RepID=A0A7N0TAZ3_KALFE